MMRRKNYDWIIWVLSAVLLIAVVGTALVDNLTRYDVNIKETLSTPVIGVAGVTEDGLVNINTADAETLMTVDGIGPATAEKIITYRDKNGDFSSVDELLEIKGIGEKSLAKWRPYIAAE